MWMSEIFFYRVSNSYSFHHQYSHAKMRHFKRVIKNENSYWDQKQSVRICM